MADLLKKVQWLFNDNWKDYFDNNADLNNQKWNTY
jgi:hypothetical protein